MIRIGCRRSRDAGLDMTPLIDTIFILLLFFVLAASFTVRGLDADLPPAQSSKAVSGRTVEIRLFENGRFEVDGVPVTREDLPFKVHEVVRSFRTQPGQLVLFAAPKAPVESLVYLVDQVRSNGGEKLTLATSPAEKN